MAFFNSSNISFDGTETQMKINSEVYSDQTEQHFALLNKSPVTPFDQKTDLIQHVNSKILSQKTKKTFFSMGDHVWDEIMQREKYFQITTENTKVEMHKGKGDIYLYDRLKTWWTQKINDNHCNYYFRFSNNYSMVKVRTNNQWAHLENQIFRMLHSFRLELKFFPNFEYRWLYMMKKQDVKQTCTYISDYLSLDNHRIAYSNCFLEEILAQLYLYYKDFSKLEVTHTEYLDEKTQNWLHNSSLHDIIATNFIDQNFPWSVDRFKLALRLGYFFGINETLLLVCSKPGLWRDLIDIYEEVDENMTIDINEYSYFSLFVAIQSGLRSEIIPELAINFGLHQVVLNDQRCNITIISQFDLDWALFPMDQTSNLFYSCKNVESDNSLISWLWEHELLFDTINLKSVKLINWLFYMLGNRGAHIINGNTDTKINPLTMLTKESIDKINKRLAQNHGKESNLIKYVTIKFKGQPRRFAVDSQAQDTCVDFADMSPIGDSVTRTFDGNEQKTKLCLIKHDYLYFCGSVLSGKENLIGHRFCYHIVNGEPDGIRIGEVFIPYDGVKIQFKMVGAWYDLFSDKIFYGNHALPKNYTNIVDLMTESPEIFKSVNMFMMGAGRGKGGVVSVDKKTKDVTKTTLSNKNDANDGTFDDAKPDQKDQKNPVPPPTVLAISDPSSSSASSSSSSSSSISSSSFSSPSHPAADNDEKKEEKSKKKEEKKKDNRNGNREQWVKKEEGKNKKNMDEKQKEEDELRKSINNAAPVQDDDKVAPEKDFFDENDNLPLDDKINPQMTRKMRRYENLRLNRREEKGEGGRGRRIVEVSPLPSNGLESAPVLSDAAKNQEEDEAEEFEYQKPDQIENSSNLAEESEDLEDDLEQEEKQDVKDAWSDSEWLGVDVYWKEVPKILSVVEANKHLDFVIEACQVYGSFLSNHSLSRLYRKTEKWEQKEQKRKNKEAEAGIPRPNRKSKKVEKARKQAIDDLMKQQSDDIDEDCLVVDPSEVKTKIVTYINSSAHKRSAARLRARFYKYKHIVWKRDICMEELSQGNISLLEALANTGFDAIQLLAHCRSVCLDTGHSIPLLDNFAFVAACEWRSFMIGNKGAHMVYGNVDCVIQYIMKGQADMDKTGIISSGEIYQTTVKPGNDSNRPTRASMRYDSLFFNTVNNYVDAVQYMASNCFAGLPMTVGAAGTTLRVSNFSFRSIASNLEYTKGIPLVGGLNLTGVQDVDTKDMYRNLREDSGNLGSYLYETLLMIYYNKPRMVMSHSYELLKICLFAISKDVATWDLSGTWPRFDASAVNFNWNNPRDHRQNVSNIVNFISTQGHVVNGTSSTWRFPRQSVNEEYRFILAADLHVTYGYVPIAIPAGFFKKYGSLGIAFMLRLFSPYPCAYYATLQTGGVLYEFLANVDRLKMSGYHRLAVLLPRMLAGRPNDQDALDAICDGVYVGSSVNFAAAVLPSDIMINERLEISGRVTNGLSELHEYGTAAFIASYYNEMSKVKILEMLNAYCNEMGVSSELDAVWQFAMQLSFWGQKKMGYVNDYDGANFNNGNFAGGGQVPGSFADTQSIMGYLNYQSYSMASDFSATGDSTIFQWRLPSISVWTQMAVAVKMYTAPGEYFVTSKYLSAARQQNNMQWICLNEYRKLVVSVDIMLKSFGLPLEALCQLNLNTGNAEQSPVYSRFAYIHLSDSTDEMICAEYLKMSYAACHGFGMEKNSQGGVHFLTSTDSVVEASGLKYTSYEPESKVGVISFASCSTIACIKDYFLCIKASNIPPWLKFVDRWDVKSAIDYFLPFQSGVITSIFDQTPTIRYILLEFSKTQKLLHTDKFDLFAYSSDIFLYNVLYSHFFTSPGSPVTAGGRIAGPNTVWTMAGRCRIAPMNCIAEPNCLNLSLYSMVLPHDFDLFNTRDDMRLLYQAVGAPTELLSLNRGVLSTAFRVAYIPTTPSINNQGTVNPDYAENILQKYLSFMPRNKKIEEKQKDAKAVNLDQKNDNILPIIKNNAIHVLEPLRPIMYSNKNKIVPNDEKIKIPYQKIFIPFRLADLPGALGVNAYIRDRMCGGLNKLILTDFNAAGEQSTSLKSSTLDLEYKSTLVESQSLYGYNSQKITKEEMIEQLKEQIQPVPVKANRLGIITAYFKRLKPLFVGVSKPLTFNEFLLSAKWERPSASGYKTEVSFHGISQKMTIPKNCIPLFLSVRKSLLLGLDYATAFLKTEIKNRVAYTSGFAIYLCQSYIMYLLNKLWTKDEKITLDETPEEEYIRETKIKITDWLLSWDYARGDSQFKKEEVMLIWLCCVEILLAWYVAFEILADIDYCNSVVWKWYKRAVIKLLNILFIWMGGLLTGERVTSVWWCFWNSAFMTYIQLLFNVKWIWIRGDDTVICADDSETLDQVYIFATQVLELKCHPMKLLKRRGVCEFLRRYICPYGRFGYLNRSIVNVTQNKPWNNASENELEVNRSVRNSLSTCQRRGGFFPLNLPYDNVPYCFGGTGLFRPDFYQYIRVVETTKDRPKYTDDLSFFRQQLSYQYPEITDTIMFEKLIEEVRQQKEKSLLTGRFSVRRSFEYKFSDLRKIDPKPARMISRKLQIDENLPGKIARIRLFHRIGYFGDVTLSKALSLGGVHLPRISGLSKLEVADLKSGKTLFSSWPTNSATSLMLTKYFSESILPYILSDAQRIDKIIFAARSSYDFLQKLNKHQMFRY